MRGAKRRNPGKAIAHSGEYVIDLYLILKEKNWSIDELIMKAKIKFDWHIDLIQLGSQFLSVTDVIDYPRMIIDINPKDWQEFFKHQTERLSAKVLK